MSNDKEVNVDNDNGDVESSYQPPPQKTIEEIVAADQEDESLRKYKEALLGAAQSEKIVVGKSVESMWKWSNLKKKTQYFPTDATDPRTVIVKKLALCVPGRDDMELDLSGDITKLKKQVFTIKEGVQYKIRIDFVVQREIVHGLKYIQKTHRMMLPGKLLWYEICDVYVIGEWKAMQLIWVSIL